MRIERATVPPAPLVISRALAPLPLLLRLATPLVAEGGACLFLKGAGAEAEIAEAERDWSMRIERFPSGTNPKGIILRISEARLRESRFGDDAQCS